MTLLRRPGARPQAVQRCKDVAAAVREQDFAKAMSLRGRRYAYAFQTFKLVNAVESEIKDRLRVDSRPLRIGIMAVGQA